MGVYARYKTGIYVNCALCGVETFIPNSVAKLRTKFYCSQKCSTKTGGRPRTGEYVDCEHCNKTFYAFRRRLMSGHGRFCSRQCWWDYEKAHAKNVKKVKKVKKEAKMTEPEKIVRMNCYWCGEWFNTTDKYHFYCSKECREKARIRKRQEVLLTQEGR